MSKPKVGSTGYVLYIIHIIISCIYTKRLVDILMISQEDQLNHQY
jgi:hypothetical protein